LATPSPHKSPNSSDARSSRTKRVSNPKQTLYSTEK
jgi:hypothetical protein